MILKETQLERDQELSALTNTPLEDIQAIEMCSPDTIRIYDGEDAPDDIETLYADYRHLDLLGYLRTLMMTSVMRRHKNLIALLKKTRRKECLDFGSGVGTHAIALMENRNHVTILDVPGPLQDFAVRRIARRFSEPNRLLRSVYPHTAELPTAGYDVVICTDVLEHVPDPLRELSRICDAMKRGGVLHLEVSTMVKPSSGHFQESICRWEQEGCAFLDEHFDRVKPTIYRKKA